MFFCFLKFKREAFRRFLNLYVRDSKVDIFSGKQALVEKIEFVERVFNDDAHELLLYSYNRNGGGLYPSLFGW